MKARLSAAGVHLFDRVSGLNVLLEEVDVPVEKFSRAPRYLSVALTNACELRCSYCYAPKYAATLDVDRVVAWAVELDGAGCLGVGFGGGEPTSHPRFAELCERITRSTSMALTFTAHGHRLTPSLIDALRGDVHSRASPLMAWARPTSGSEVGRSPTSATRLRGFVPCRRSASTRL
jgi:hypothetical protein